jgi:hypothetical protein
MRIKSLSVKQHFSNVKQFNAATTGPQIHLAAMKSLVNEIETFLNFRDLNVAIDSAVKNSVLEVSVSYLLKFKQERSDSLIEADQAHDLQTLRHIFMSEMDSLSKILTSNSCGRQEAMLPSKSSRVAIV